MTHPEFNPPWASHVLRAKWDADSSKKTQIFIFRQRNQRLSISKIDFGVNHVLLHLLSSRQSTRQRVLVSIFQIAAHG